MTIFVVAIMWVNVAIVDLINHILLKFSWDE